MCEIRGVNAACYVNSAALCVPKTTKDSILILWKLRTFNLSSLCVHSWMFVHVYVNSDIVPANISNHSENACFLAICAKWASGWMFGVYDVMQGGWITVSEIWAQTLFNTGGKHHETLLLWWQDNLQHMLIQLPPSPTLAVFLGYS